jgi:dipeptidyl aminopeptidase/acylaminoacyl peptidase
MLRGIVTFLLFYPATILLSQPQTTKLTVEKIMQDPKWIGTSPSTPRWSADSKTLFFNWNPEKAPSDSLYFITTSNKIPLKASVQQKQNLVFDNSTLYNSDRSAYVYSKDGDIFYADVNGGRTKKVTQTIEAELNPQFSFNDSKIVYTRSQNLFAWNIATGETQQLTNLKTGTPASASAATNTQATTGISNQQEAWLKKDQLQYFEVLRSRKEKKDKADAYTKATEKKELRSIAIEDRILQGLKISPDGRFVSYYLNKPVTGNKTTIVPSYVTETGFTMDILARTKVGEIIANSELFVYDREKDTVFAVKTDSIPGINDLPAYLKDYPKIFEEKSKKPVPRMVTFSGPQWSPGGEHALFEIRSIDNKDRWLMLWDTSTARLRLLDRQRDEAWIASPGWFDGLGWIDSNIIWFQSEATGYSHLYTINLINGQKKTLTSGNYEVQSAKLSNDKKYFYIITNEVHPGEKDFYRLTIANGKKEKITKQTGGHEVFVSPDEKYLAVLYSYSNKPWELYLQENKTGAKAEQITSKGQSDEFKAYSWRDPELITFKARDNATVYARIYKPSNPHPNRPAVVFVHGAGYLQNAHRWWSYYFREFMFNNMLADNGYYVLDIDYRGSAGYGRDWRTGIYRHMGGKDLTDQVDGVNWLIKTYNVNPAYIGIYGGSYGGFITLMGLFTEPNVFAAGAALRPVTDWANYNHGYTSDILNEPFNDSIAFRKSSPIYFAEGLKGHLLICHGMLDVNVHYQDAVKLAQRLIELGKENWELASYPMEDHAFMEPSSWTDEYKRIFKLFEDVLKKP